MSAANVPLPNSSGNPEIYSAGTLRYARWQLPMLFFWLMWNDFSFQLLEELNKLTSYIYKDNGATLEHIGIFASVGGLIGLPLGPFISTFSDRFRSRWGRRRPILLIVAPLFACTVAMIPFMPDLAKAAENVPAFAGLLSYIPKGMNSAVFLIGVTAFVAGIFNTMLQTLFSYLWYDVVPEKLMGRFSSMTAIVSGLSFIVWNAWILSNVGGHFKEAYVGVAVFCVLIYVLSVVKTKEGQYPPPDKHTKGGMIAPLRAYFVECYLQPYYLWIFIGSLFFQFGNWAMLGPNNPHQFFIRDDLHLDYHAMGWVGKWSSIVNLGFTLILGYFVGSFIDRLKPVRLIAPAYFLLALIYGASYFFVQDANSYLISTTTVGIVKFGYNVAMTAFIVQVFPMEKRGQFCSAQAFFYQIIIIPLLPYLGRLFDWIGNNRVAYLWTGCFYTLAALVFVKVYFNWKERHGKSPVPHAG